jgi:hypothetical protein
MNKFLLAIVMIATAVLSGCGTAPRYVTSGVTSSAFVTVPPGCYSNSNQVPLGSPPVHPQQNGLLCVTNYDRIGTPIIGQRVVLNDGRSCTWRDRTASAALGSTVSALIAYAVTGNGRYVGRAAAGGVAAGMLFCDPDIIDDDPPRTVVQQQTQGTRTATRQTRIVDVTLQDGTTVPNWCDLGEIPKLDSNNPRKRGCLASDGKIRIVSDR